MPETVRQLLEIVSVVQKGKKNDDVLRRYFNFLLSFEKEQVIIQQAINQAKEKGNDKLADDITQLSKKTVSYRKTKISYSQGKYIK